jgi:hypothetical protein
VQFAASSYEQYEGKGSVQISVLRTGDVSTPATVNYTTFDKSHPGFVGYATQKADYQIALGTLRFNPGETSKTFSVLLEDDAFAEGDEVLNIALSNPTGTALGSPNTATLTIWDNDVFGQTGNPIDGASLFVRQQYLDFLNREPDLAGLNFWVGNITSCGSDAGCIEVKRIHVSAAFFLSIEFQQTSYEVLRTYRAAYGRDPLYGEFMGDTQILQRNFIFGQPGADAQLETNKQDFFASFGQRNEFRATLEALTNAQYVDRLIANSGILFPAAMRDQWVADLNGATKTRLQVLRELVEAPAYANHQATLNRAFVLMEYFGYLRRDPDTSGFNFWVAKLSSFGGDFIKAEMVKAFISSSEYCTRFGQS